MTDKSNNESTTEDGLEVNVRAASAEVVVAHYLKQRYPDTKFFGGNKRGYDAVGGLGADRNPDTATMRVDAKKADIKMRCLSNAKTVEMVIQFAGTKRKPDSKTPDTTPPEARHAVTHYGLVVFAESSKKSGLCSVTASTSDTKPVVTVQAQYEVERLFVVPREEVNSLFKKPFRKNGEPATGFVLCAPIGLVEKFEQFL